MLQSVVEEFREWVAPSALRNWFADDPLLDWLDLYGRERGFVPDFEREGYDRSLDFSAFLMEQGRRFEAEAMRLIERRLDVHSVPSGKLWDRAAYEATLSMLRGGVEAIAQGVVWDEARRTFARPDLLVRADRLGRLADEPPEDEDGTAGYRVVDLKFKSLEINGRGWLGGVGKHQAQLLVCNRALGAMSGFEPTTAYLIGRDVHCDTAKVEFRTRGCLDKLVPVNMAAPKLAEAVEEAIAWARRVRSEGADWQVLPEPSNRDLYPNMSNRQDSPWHHVKNEIAEALGELTLLWQVTPKNRHLALDRGVVTFSDDRAASADFGHKEEIRRVFQALARINATGCDRLAGPHRIAAGESDWRLPNPVEFFVDFETVTDVNDDFAGFPAKGGVPMISMVGCGHEEDGEWKFSVFTCDRLDPECERRILDDWHAHMAAVASRRWPGGEPLVFHWSHAERSFLNTAYNSARERHGDRWPPVRWYDLLNNVVKKEPFVVRGALAFGLKAVAGAMFRNGLIGTEWAGGPVSDGMGAMMASWQCDKLARERGGSMQDFDLMREVERYNEVDCRVMWEILRYLRANH